jgi:phage tail sheath protein FI
MPESLAPGVYIREVQSLLRPIEGVSTGAAGFGVVAIGGSIPLTGGINLLRFFLMQGGQIWGARTTSQDPGWQDINIRRLAISIVQSINQRVQFAVFENNGPSLWAALTSSIEGYLTTVWQSGGLHGKKRQDASFVRCDSGTMTQSDVDSGRFVIIVGFAPLRPAEFIVLQITGQTKRK